MSVIVAPSILTADMGRLADQVRAAVDGGAEYIHLDVMDGKFVPVITFGPLVVQAVRKAVGVTLDIHLMIERPDERRFQALALARQAMRLGGTAPAVLNAANEVAVEAFLAGRIGFLQIAQLVADTLELADTKGVLGLAKDLDTVLNSDAAGRALALNLLENCARS